MKTATVKVGFGPTATDVAAALEKAIGTAAEVEGPGLAFDAGAVLWLLYDDSDLRAEGVGHPFVLDLVAPLTIQATESRRVFDRLVDATDWPVQLWAEDNRVLVAERR